jgi:hypothetical protein
MIAFGIAETKFGCGKMNKFTKEYFESIHGNTTEYATEKDMPHSIRTDISTNEMKRLEQFLLANNMGGIRLGYYEKQDTSSIFKSVHRSHICYLVGLGDTVAETNLMYMILKYGSLENAFNDYLKKLRSL